MSKIIVGTGFDIGEQNPNQITMALDFIVHHLNEELHRLHSNHRIFLIQSVDGTDISLDAGIQDVAK